MIVCFKGAVDSQEAIAASQTFLDLMGLGKVRLWFDVRDVSAYPFGARDAWQQALLPHRDQITEIGVASRSALTRLGGTMFALFLGAPFRPLTDADLDDL